MLHSHPIYPIHPFHPIHLIHPINPINSIHPVHPIKCIHCIQAEVCFIFILFIHSSIHPFILFILAFLTTAFIAIKQRYASFSSYSIISSSYQLHLWHYFFGIKICIKKNLSYPFLNVKKCQGDSAKNARAKVLGQKY